MAEHEVSGELMVKILFSSGSFSSTTLSKEDSVPPLWRE
jgi:hypothetical protein